MSGVRGRRSRLGTSVVGAALVLSACGGGGDGGDDAASSAPVETVAVSAAEVAAPTTVATTTTTTEPPLTTADTLTTGGLGEIRIGMAVGEAEVAGGRLLDTAPGDAEQDCFVATIRDLPGVEIVVAEGRIRVIDITTSAITTSSGAAVGMAADGVRELFGERIDETPVEGAAALTFVPADAADQDKRVVFFTDGTNVTRMMSGTLPHVLRVDPCLPTGG